jgi:hypothetical protein
MKQFTARSCLALGSIAVKLCNRSVGELLKFKERSGAGRDANIAGTRRRMLAFNCSKIHFYMSTP